ncbi:MAG: peptidyl-prolyl cis-trans isomerase [Planctomycetota bacterium]
MRNTRSTVLMISCGALLSGGCAELKRTSNTRPEPIRERVGLTAFEGTYSAARSVPPAPQVMAPVPEGPNRRVDVVAQPGGPELADPDTPTENETDYIVVTSLNRVVIDLMVGQINGEPVYAEEFLEPLDALLRSSADRMRGGREGWEQQWIAQAAERINVQMRSKIRDELVLAEFYANITSPEEELGVLNYIQRIRDELESQNLGSSELSKARFLETRGLTLDELVEQLSTQQLISAQLQRDVYAKLPPVTYEDIERFYRDNEAEFNPPGVALLSIMLTSSDEGTIQEVRDAFAQGKTFFEVSQEHNKLPETSWTREVALEEGGLGATTFYGNEALNSAVQSLSSGEMTEPVMTETSAWWIEATEVRTDEGRSLYEVQLLIEAAIRNQREREAELVYLNTLLQRANVSSIETMVGRLVDYATNKYVAGFVFERQ